MIRNFVKDAVKYLPAQIVPGIVGFISIPIITRLFSPQNYGNYSLAMAAIMVLVALCGWLPMSIIRFYPVYERDKKEDVFYGNIVKLGGISILVITVIFCFVLFLSKAFFSRELHFFMSIGIGVFIAIAIFNMLQHVLRSKREVGWYSRFAIWKTVMGFGLGLGLIFFFGLGIDGLFWGIIISIAMIIPLLWKKAIGGIAVFQIKIKFLLFKEMIKYSFPLVVSNLAAWILSLSDRYILEFFRGSGEVGIYSASYNISDRSLMLLVALFMLASGPISIHVWEKEGRVKSEEFVTKTTRYYLLGCIPAVVGLSILCKPVMCVLTGKQYFEGYKIIPLIALGVLFFGLQQRFQSGFFFYKKTHFVTLAIVASGVLNLALNFMFIPKYGYLAAAVTTFISYLFLLILMIIGSRQIFIWRFPFKSLINSVCATAIMAMIVYFVGSGLTSVLWLNLILAVCLGILVYFALLFLLNEIKQGEKEVVKRTLSRFLLNRVVFRKH